MYFCWFLPVAVFDSKSRVHLLSCLISTYSILSSLFIYFGNCPLDTACSVSHTGLLKLVAQRKLFQCFRHLPSRHALLSTESHRLGYIFIVILIILKSHSTLETFFVVRLCTATLVPIPCLLPFTLIYWNSLCQDSYLWI